MAALTRVWLAAVVPLTDTTEARFAEMARKMVESGAWLVPQHDYGVPYLAKPPLTMWLSAAGIGAFGDGELGPRALILAATIGFVVALFRCVRRWLGDGAALTTLLVLCSSGLFFVAAAAVMTDMLLTIATCAALLGFFERLRGGAAGAEAVLYAALAVGLLVKGPLILVLAGLPIVLWSVATGRVRDVWRRLAWLKGALLMLAIAAPWYLAAERANPGFLRYFLVGEHLQRFLVPGWSGDLYGRAHDVPRGGVWLFFVVGALPWSLLAVPLLKRAWPRVRTHWGQHRELVAFWLIAAATPLVLFSFAGNVVWPYALPALPPAALAFAALLHGSERGASSSWRFAAVAGVAVAAVALGAAVGAPFIETHSQRAAVRAALALHPGGSVPVYYWQTRHFSADYYGRGRARVLEDATALKRELATQGDFVLVVPERRLAALPATTRSRLRPRVSVGDMLLLEPARQVRNGS
jgi:4-amino-4-deoxy-L-arabinose transferase-like glycosyltransferase